MNRLSFTLGILILLGLLVSSKLSIHEYYFSVMTMEKNEENQTLEVEYRIFSDDLEKALGQTEEYHLRLGDEREVPEADSLIFEYIFDHVSFSGEGWENIDMSYVGKDIQNDISFIYIEYSGMTNWGNVDITNKILFEHFEDQQNQLSLIHEGEVLSQYTIKDYPKRTVNLTP